MSKSLQNLIKKMVSYRPENPPSLKMYRAGEVTFCTEVFFYIFGHPNKCDQNNSRGVQNKTPGRFWPPEFDFQPHKYKQQLNIWKTYLNTKTKMICFPTTFMFGSPFLRPRKRHTQNSWKNDFDRAPAHQIILLLLLLLYLPPQLCQGYIEGIYKVCTGYIQGMYRVYTGYREGIQGVCRRFGGSKSSCKILKIC